MMLEIHFQKRNKQLVLMLVLHFQEIFKNLWFAQKLMLKTIYVAVDILNTEIR